MTGYACSGSDSKKYAVVFDLTTHLYIHRYKKKIARTRQAVEEKKKMLKITLLRKSRLKRKTRKKTVYAQQ